MVQSHSEKVDSHSHNQEIPSFYGTQKLTVFTRTHCCTLSWTSWNHLISL